MSEVQLSEPDGKDYSYEAAVGGFRIYYYYVLVLALALAPSLALPR